MSYRGKQAHHMLAQPFLTEHPEGLERVKVDCEILCIISVHMVQLPVFCDRISNCTNLFRLEPNQTQDIRIC